MEQLEYRYRRRGHDVLRGVDATLRRGDRVAVMGPNGSGKSTLLHLLAGLQRPDSGSIAWTDQRPSLGLVVQEPDLMLFSETVRDEVAFAPIHQHLPRPQRQPLVDDVLDRTGLTALADRPPLALSRGQRLRAAVASVLSKQPEVLLLDEPTTGQDRRHIEQMMSHLEDQCDAMVFCTHDVQTAARHANRIWLLVDGRIIADGPPHEVLFDESAMQRASLRPSAAQAYAARLGVRALDVDELLRRRRP